MKKFLYRIKTPEKKERGWDDVVWSYDISDTGIVEAEDRKEVREKVEKLHNKKFVMRSKAEDIAVKNFFLLTIFELEKDSYWEKYWLGENKCKNDKCNLTYTNLEKAKIGVSSKFCSTKCENEFKEQKQDEFNKWFNSVNSGAGNIYKITNKENNKCYIGQTIQPITLRWWQHISSNNTKKFGEALSKYPLDKWTFEVIATDVNIDELDKLERYYIDFYNSKKDGYNTI